MLGKNGELQASWAKLDSRKRRQGCCALARSLAPERPVDRLGLALLLVLILSAPWLLFFDPIVSSGGGTFARSARHLSPLQRRLRVRGRLADARADVANLFVPHNTHIVPAWRVLTWALVAWSGSLEKLPEVLAEASYGILAAVMLLTGRFVARETGRTGVGLAAMAAVGTTSVMASPTCWYSAGQTLWAGFGILATLWYAQAGGGRRTRRARRWRPFRRCSPAGSGRSATSPARSRRFTWLDGRRRCRMAAAVPLAATVLAVGLSVILGGSKIDSTVSFHGRTTREAIRPVEGLLHTAQAIPENLVLGNLGLKVHTTETQGVVLTLLLLGAWCSPRWRQGRLRAFNPLECTGAALVLGAIWSSGRSGATCRSATCGRSTWG